MIIWEIEGTRVYTYSKFDIPNYRHNVVGKIANVTKKDIGKYIPLNDGSKQYVKILAVSGACVQTSSGLYYKWEIICMINPRRPFTTWSGAEPGDENLQVQPATFEELALVRDMTNNMQVKNISRRIRVMADKSIAAYLESKNITKEKVLDKAIDLAFGKTNQHTMNALKGIANALDMDMFEKKKDTVEKPLSFLEMIGRQEPTVMISMDEGDVVEVEDV